MGPLVKALLINTPISLEVTEVRYKHQCYGPPWPEAYFTLFFFFFFFLNRLHVFPFMKRLKILEAQSTWYDWNYCDHESFQVEIHTRHVDRSDVRVSSLFYLYHSEKNTLQPLSSLFLMGESKKYQAQSTFFSHAFHISGGQYCQVVCAWAGRGCLIRRQVPKSIIFKVKLSFSLTTIKLSAVIRK